MANDLSRYEKETIINFNQEEANCSIYTCDDAWMRKMDELMKKDARIMLETKDKYSKTYLCPKKWVKVLAPRVLTEEKRQKLIIQLKKNFAKHKKSPK